jgi:hypothetical protein
MKTKARKTMGVVKNMSLHAVGICAGLPLIGLGACAKKQVKAENLTLVKEVEVQAGVLHFKTEEALNDYLDAVQLQKTANYFVGFTAWESDTVSRRSFDVPESFGILKKVFNGSGELVIAETTYALRADGVYKKVGDNWVLSRSFAETGRAKSNNDLNVCQDLSAKQKKSTRTSTVLQNTLWDIEDYLAEHQADIQVLLQGIQQDKPVLQSILNGTAGVELSDEQKAVIKTLLDLENLQADFSQVQALNDTFSEQSKHAYYLNTFIQEKHPDLLMPLQKRLLRAHSRGFLSWLGGLVSAVGEGIFGVGEAIGGNRPNATQVANQVISEIKPLLDDMKEIMTAQQAQINLLTQTVDKITGVLDKITDNINALTAIVSNQQVMLEAIWAFITANKPIGTGTGTTPKLFASGKNSVMVRALAEHAGIKGTETQYAVETMGEWIDKHDLVNELDYSLYAHFEDMSRQGDKHYYHLMHVYKQNAPELGKTLLYTKRYSLRTNEQFSTMEDVPAGFHNRLSTDVELTYKNEIGLDVTLQQKDKQKVQGLQNYPVVIASVPYGYNRNICVKSFSASDVTYNARFDASQNFEGTYTIY